MKIFTRKMVAIVAATLITGFASAQQTIVQSFASSETNDLSSLPTVAGEAATYTLPSGQWTLYNCKWYSSGYLMLCKAASPLEAGALTLPTVSFKVGSISVVTGSNASVKVTMSLYAGDELVETKTLDAKGETFTWALSDQTVGTVYKFVVANANNAQFQSVTITEASTSPTVSFKDAGDVEFGTALNEKKTINVGVIGENLSDDITAFITGTDADKFTISPTSVATGGAFEVTYNGINAGTANAVLTIQSGAATASTNLVGTTVSHAGTVADPLTLADVNTLNNTAAGPYWVAGTIAGCAANVSESVPTGTTDTYVASNLTLSEGGLTESIPVALPTALRTAWSLVDNPSKINQEVIVHGTLENYFSRPGVKNTTAIITSAPTEVATIAALKALYASDPSAYFSYTGTATVTLASNASGDNTLYVQDETGAIEIYDADANALTTAFSAGDGITNVKGTFGMYNSMLEILPTQDAEKVTSTAVTPAEKTIAQLTADNQSELVILKDMTFSDFGQFAAATSYSVSNAEGQSTNVRVSYDDLPLVGTDIPTDKVDITGIVSVYNNEIQIIPTQITAVPTGIEAIDAANANTKVEIFTVSGQKIGKLAKGINVVKTTKADGTVSTSKVLVK